MDWLALAMLAAALNGAVSSVDKFIVAKQIPDPAMYAFFMSTVGMVSAIVMWFAQDIHIVPLGPTFLALSSGILYLAYIALYFAALAYGDASVVVALGQITPVFTTLWGFTFLGERYDTLTYVGVGLVIAGSVVLSREENVEGDTKTPAHLNQALLLMLAGCFFNSISQLMLKSSLQEIRTLDGFFWPRIGVFLGGVILIMAPSRRRALGSAFRGMDRRVYGLIAGNEVIALAAVLAMTLAYGEGPLTLVTASSATQPLFVIFFVWLVNRLRPGTVPDRTDRRLFAVRLLPLTMIGIGVYLLSR